MMWSWEAISFLWVFQIALPSLWGPRSLVKLKSVRTEQETLLILFYVFVSIAYVYVLIRNAVHIKQHRIKLWRYEEIS